MHVKSLLHVRDYSKTTGPAHHLLEYIAQYTNQYTGEAFELTVDRLAHRLRVTPQWVGQLKARLVASGELEVKQSRGRYPNVYVIPWAHCHLCQGAVEPDDSNPKVQFGVMDHNPNASPAQPQSQAPPTPNSASPTTSGNVLYFPGVQPQSAPQKENVKVKEEKEKDVNVEITQANPKQPNPKPPDALTPREDDLVEALVRRFRDEKSRATYRRIVGALGEDITYRLLLGAWEVRNRIAVSPGAYFVGMAKNVAREQGIDLGFQRSAP